MHQKLWKEADGSICGLGGGVPDALIIESVC